MRHRIVKQIAAGILLFTGMLSGQSTRPMDTRGCTISGRILNGGNSERIGDATVQLADASTSTRDLISSPDFLVLGKISKPGAADVKTKSLDDGSFCLPMVAPGKYVLSATKLGFIDSYYGATSYAQIGSVLVVRDKRINNITVALTPTSGIVGRIVDRDGKPVEKANAVAVKAGWYQGRQVFMPVQGALTDEHGEYHIGNLTAGTYYVYAQSGFFIPVTGSGLQMVRTYHPSNLNLSESGAVSVAPGKDARGIDIRVIKANTYHVRGKLHDTKDLWGGGLVQLVPREEERMVLVISAGSNLSSDGSFDFPNVSQGFYKLYFLSAAGASQLDVEVRNSDIFLNVPVFANAQLHGKVVGEPLPDSGYVAMPKIALKPAGALVGPTYQVNINGAGEIKADGITPGKYFLNIATPAGEFVKSIEVAGSNLGGRKLDLTAGGGVDLTIVVGSGSAALNGSVIAVSQVNKTPLGYHVIAISSPPKLDGSGVYFAASDSTGRFYISNVFPGKYRICGLQSVDAQIFQNLGLLQQIADMGTEVALYEKQSRSVEVPLISSDMLESHIPPTTRVK